MTLQYKQDNDRFYVCNDNNQEIAEMTFTRIGHDKATINHTFTDPAYRGHGIADSKKSVKLYLYVRLLKIN